MLSPNFIQKRKKDLLAEKKRLERELSQVAKKKGKKFTAIYPEYGSKEEENAEEITRYTLNLALDKNLEKLLAETLAALEKIKQDTYVKCEGCKKEINPERLEAFPAANLCIDCQSKRESPLKRLFAKIKNRRK